MAHKLLIVKVKQKVKFNFFCKQPILYTRQFRIHKKQYSIGKDFIDH